MTLELLVQVEGTTKVVNHLSLIENPLQSYMKSVFPTRNGIFQLDSVSCQKARYVLGRFKEHKDEFQSKSWSPNSTDLNLKRYLSVFIER
ncbi:hypothetical protein TNCV_1912321 [Trichonephila clavipes]|nr:hypothetical protein TNCV_1912321 [Trichonephila clavipes]